jgi:hypothetical protein
VSEAKRLCGFGKVFTVMRARLLSPYTGRVSPRNMVFLALPPVPDKLFEVQNGNFFLVRWNFTSIVE